MRTTSVVPRVCTRTSRPRPRAAVALPAAFVLAFGLAACGSEEQTDDQSAAAETTQATGTGRGEQAANPSAGESSAAPAPNTDGAPASGDPAAPTPGDPATPDAPAPAATGVDPNGNNPAAAGSAADAPALGNTELLLTAADFPGMQYQTISPQDTQQMVEQFKTFAASVQFTPPECADASSITAAVPEGAAMASVIDSANNVAFTIGVIGTGINTREFVDQNNRCSTVTLSGSGISGTTNTTQVPGPAIDGSNVQAFDVHSTSRVEALNKEQTQAVTNYQITTRGVTFRVAATQLQDQITPEVRAQLDDIARRQADKIRNS